MPTTPYECKCADGPLAGQWYMASEHTLRHGMAVHDGSGRVTGRYRTLHGPTSQGGQEVYIARYWGVK